MEDQAGQVALGRGAVVDGSGAAPPAMEAAPRVRIDAAVLAEPRGTTDTLHRHWLERRPVVVELAVPASTLRTPGVEAREPWEVGAGFEFTLERLQFLVWANNWDARDGEPVWWWSRKAVRVGALEGGPADVTVGGAPVFIDGGPRGTCPSAVGGVAVVHRESVELGSLGLGRSHAASRAVPGSDALLAPDQAAAVAHALGAARIIAPAGSGKTRVLTERVRYLLAERGWEPGTLTAVAFNKRAADELLGRTPGLGAHVRTVNALGLAILTGQVGGRRPPMRPSVLSEPDVRRLLDGMVDVRRQPNTDVLAPFIEGLSAIRIGLRDPEEVEAALPDASGLTQVWERYRDHLQASHALDFDAQVYEAIRVLLTEPEVRASAQQRCRHLLCDEFQDLAPAHLLLLRLLSAPGYDVFGVGDDDQVIYGYAGATPSYLIEFDRWFPGAATHALETNYRCPVRVVEAATKLLSYNDVRIDKRIGTPPGAQPGTLSTLAVDGADMATTAVGVVAAALEAGRDPGDIAILARVNSALLPVQVALTTAGLACERPLDRRVLERTGVRAALAWLRLGCDPGSIARSDVADTIRRPSRRISRNVVDMLTKKGRTSTHDIRRLAGRLSGGDADKLVSYAVDIEAVARAVPSGTAAALGAIRTSVGLGQAMDSLDASRAEADRSTHADDLRALEQVAALHPNAATFGAWLADALDQRPTGSSTSVTLSTVHRVKGQEWPVVIVFGAHGDAFPHRLATDVEEERRVFHVALTRASAEVVVLGDAAHPSPFVEEMAGARPRVALRGRLSPAAPPPPQGGPPASPASTRSALAQARQSVSDADPDERVWDALRRWRTETAAREAVPPFVIFSDRHLKAIGVRLPSTAAELRSCPGVGPTKLDRYGDELLAVLEAIIAGG